MCSAFIATTHDPELSGSAFVQENSGGVRLFHPLSVYVRIAQIIEQCQEENSHWKFGFWTKFHIFQENALPINPVWVKGAVDAVCH